MRLQCKTFEHNTFQCMPFQCKKFQCMRNQCMQFECKNFQCIHSQRVQLHACGFKACSFNVGAILGPPPRGRLGGPEKNSCGCRGEQAETPRNLQEIRWSERPDPRVPLRNTYVYVRLMLGFYRFLLIVFICFLFVFYRFL